MYITDLKKRTELFSRDIDPTDGSKICGCPTDESPLGIGVVAALGSFDGVHAGHAALIKRAVRIAHGSGFKAAVFTFTDEPSALPGKSGMRSITSTDEKLSLIASLGADIALLEDFSRIKDYSPEQFVNELLRTDCNVKYAVCGFNFRFGRGGAGDPETLRTLMPDGCCEVVAPVSRAGRLVSSSAIRALIEDGDLESAAELLDHPFLLELPVIHGKALGRTIGVPTINQRFPDSHIIPKFGIYASQTVIDGKSYVSVSNIGIRPTIEGDDHRVNCETHIIGYDGLLYDRRIRVELYKRLRNEMRFSGVDELRARIGLDIEAARAYFESKPDSRN